MRKMQIKGVYMNKLTRKIRNKGYTLLEFCEVIGYSLRWYREHVNKSNKQNDLINDEIDNLETRKVNPKGATHWHNEYNCFLKEDAGNFYWWDSVKWTYLNNVGSVLFQTTELEVK